VEAMTSQWTMRNRKKFGDLVKKAQFKKKCMQFFEGRPLDYEQHILKPLWPNLLEKNSKRKT